MTIREEQEKENIRYSVVTLRSAMSREGVTEKNHSVI